MTKSYAAICSGNMVAAMVGTLCMIATGFHWATFILTIANIAIFFRLVWMACKVGQQFNS